LAPLKSRKHDYILSCIVLPLPTKCTFFRRPDRLPGSNFHIRDSFQDHCQLGFMIHVGRFSGSMTCFLSFSVKIGPARPVTNVMVQRIVLQRGPKNYLRQGKFAAFSEGRPTRERRFCQHIVLYIMTHSLP
jgi:hypothetical protein